MTPTKVINAQRLARAVKYTEESLNRQKLRLQHTLDKMNITERAMFEESMGLIPKRKTKTHAVNDRTQGRISNGTE